MESVQETKNTRSTLIPRTNERLKLKGVHFESWGALKAQLNLDSLSSGCLFSDLSLGAQKGHWVLNELNGQLGLSSYDPVQPLIGIRSEQKYADTISRLIDNESIGDVNFLAAYAGCKEIIDQLVEQHIKCIVIIPPNSMNEWEDENLKFVRLLTQGLETIDCDLVILGYPKSNLGTEWDVVFENDVPDSVNSEGEFGLPGVLDRELVSLFKDLIPDSSLELANNYVIASPLTRLKMASNTTKCLGLLSGQEAYSHLYTYFNLLEIDESANVEVFQLEAAKRFSEGAYAIALRMLKAIKDKVQDPLILASITSQIQNIRIALMYFSEAAQEATPSLDLPDEYKASLFQAKAWGLVMTNQAQEAEAYFEQARTFLSEKDHPRMYLYLMNISALNKLRIGEVDTAFRFEREIEEKLSERDVQDWHILYINSINQARLYKKVNDLVRAEEYYMKAFEINNSLKVESDLLYTNFCLAQLEDLKGNNPASYTYYLCACIHWLCNETPESLAPRVAQAVLCKNLSSEIGRVNDISKRLIDQLKTVISKANIEVKDLSRARLNFRRINDSIHPEIAIGTHGIGFFATNEIDDTGYSCEAYDQLKLLVSNCLRTDFPELNDFKTLYTDTVFGNELPCSSKELISSCIYYGVDKLIFGSNKFYLSEQDRNGLLMSSAVRLCGAISSARPSENQIVIYFKRYNSPIAVEGLEREILSLVSAASTVQGIIQGIGDDKPVLEALKEMQRKKLITISLL
ncbi:tetratricopeptide repeat protein [Olleya sp. Bg11-27]|uniref:tetratricopeptide repeat protein n=1 Tax=Olleya sp. Bg11-27 TaxID=2058135 RepID=UPI000C30D213|nr:hypothetical protein [Olleya sp. Bg11-27]AUC75981.1 hypothetical protein CW732_10030 [Olleya sp. Bg11-27]